MSKRFTITDDRLRRLYVTEQLSTSQIAERFGVDHTTVSARLKALGVELRGRTARARDLYR